MESEHKQDEIECEMEKVKSELARMESESERAEKESEHLQGEIESEMKKSGKWKLWEWMPEHKLNAQCMHIIHVKMTASQ